MLKKYIANRYPSKPWKHYLFWFKVGGGMKIWLSFQANFIGFSCRIHIWHYRNKFRKLMAKYSNDLKDHKGYKSEKILPFASVMLSPLGNCNCSNGCLACLGYPTDTELMKWEWMARAALYWIVSIFWQRLLLLVDHKVYHHSQDGVLQMICILWEKNAEEAFCLIF